MVSRYHCLMVKILDLQVDTIEVHELLLPAAQTS
jgi:hypothetical protein